VDRQAAAGAVESARLTRTPGTTPEDAARLRQSVPLEVPPAPQTAALALLRVPVRGGSEAAVTVLGRAVRPAPAADPVYVWLLLPEALLPHLSGDLHALAAVAAAIPLEPALPLAEPLPFPAAPTWSQDSRIALLRAALALVGGDFDRLRRLAGAALHPAGLLIQQFPGDLADRLTLIQALLLLLPAPLRARMTFTTHTTAPAGGPPAIVFSDQSGSDRWRYQADSGTFDTPPPMTAYLAYLGDLWQGDVAALVPALRGLDALALHLLPGQPLEDGLRLLVQRHQLEQALQQRQPVTADALLVALTGSAPPAGEQRTLYLERLLLAALEERHTRAAAFVAHAMDEDSALDDRLAPLLETALTTGPDAVYVFVRARLTENNAEHWLARLHAAARQSLLVAVEQGDSTTVIEWLRLIAREPARYQLGEMLYTGLLAAADRTDEDGGLAIDLLTLAVKRAANAVPALLQNPRLVAALPADVHAAVIDHRREAIESIAGQSRELFLLALLEATTAHTLCITIPMIKALWELYQAPGSAVLAEPYQPINVMRRLLAGTPDCMDEGALETLLTLLLTGGEDTLFRDMVPQVAPAAFGDALASALEQSGRSLEDSFTLLGQLAADGKLSHQAHIDIHESLFLNSSDETLQEQVAENLARLLSQYMDVTAATGVLWKLLEHAAEMRSDLLVRVASKRLLADFNDIATESGMVEALLRLRKLTSWSSVARTIILTWWRNYARSQPAPQLQKLEKILESRRGPLADDFRHILHTAIALRRLIGQKTLEEFADDISTAYRVLQALADGFDPDPRQPMSIDMTTLRTMMGARLEDLSPDMRQVLATNLKELAQIITELAENRSRPNLLGRDESVDRALMTGEQQPESALDVMKFLSGYLDGSQQPRSETQGNGDGR
ncbi:MAG: hypothetical protein MUE40_21220, partial [Anaerolineae bacterium]|nr:hypothetical protein [Anaerolineae bacterium]